MTSPPDESPARTDSAAAPPVTSTPAGAPAPPRRRRSTTESASPAPPTVAPPPVAPLEPTGKAAPSPRPTRRPRRTAPKEPAPESLTKTVFGDDEDDRPRRTRRRDRPPAARPASVPRGERRFRQTLVKVDLWSVTKLALCFYLSAMFVTIVAMIALWMIADAAGIIKSVEDFFGDLLSAKNFKFLSGEVLRGTILVGLVIVALQVVITVIAASFYNIFSELFGGLEIVVKEEGEAPR